ncbi:uncharacterized protein LOC143452398 [Clavelina lepadiformis]|uniref:uncharacterized protein LOC143452398 n=1 Tax=Clavelina lepadiformis TaxID=159417 RepID=UPI004041C416
MKYIRLFFCIAIVLATLVRTALTQEDGEAEDNSNSTVVACYSCNSTEICDSEQNEENGTTVECDGQHCWTWKYDEDGIVTYARGCGDICTEDSKELDCMTSNNKTECTKCCSDGLCNSDLLNHAALARINPLVFLSGLGSVFACIFVIDNIHNY